MASSKSSSYNCKRIHRFSYLANPLNYHRPCCRALLQCGMLEEHIIPAILDPELIVPEEVPHDFGRHILI